MSMAEQADQIALCAGAIDVAGAMAGVTDPAAGGVAVFLGTTRADGQTTHLDYEAYEAMALSQMRSIAVEARAKWPIRKLAVLHRTGRVAVGEVSVLVAVSTPHRAEAFEACRFIIDAIKASAAIWKKELTAGGEGTWVEPRA